MQDLLDYFTPCLTSFKELISEMFFLNMSSQHKVYRPRILFIKTKIFIVQAEDNGEITDSLF
jgi:hypothetical protein